MKNLYKGRYLIAIYNKYDECIGVFSSLNELKQNRELLNPYSLFSRISNNKYCFLSHKYYLIDCLEKHEDIFEQEDQLFLEECNEKNTIKSKAKELGISPRTYYRKKECFKEREL